MSRVANQPKRLIQGRSELIFNNTFQFGLCDCFSDLGEKTKIFYIFTPINDIFLAN